MRLYMYKKFNTAGDKKYFMSIRILLYGGFYGCWRNRVYTFKISAIRIDISYITLWGTVYYVFFKTKDELEQHIAFKSITKAAGINIALFFAYYVM